MKKIILLVVSIFLLSGCYDYQELNDVSIINGIGVDYKDDKYLVSLEVITSSKEGTSSKIKTYVITGKDENIVTAFNNAMNKANKKVYMQHVKGLILGKEVCVHGIDEVLDYIVRDVTINNNYFIVATDNAKDIFNTEASNDSITNVIIDTVDSAMNGSNLDDLDLTAANLLNNRIDIAIPYVEADDKEFKVNEIIYFNNNKAKDKISNKIYNFLTLNTLENSFTRNENTINIYKKKISYKCQKDKIIINIDGYGIVQKINKNINLKDINDYKKLENYMNEQVMNEVTVFLEETLNNDSDILGLENIYYKKYKKNMKNIKYEVKTNIKISKNGTIYEVIHD